VEGHPFRKTEAPEVGLCRFGVRRIRIDRVDPTLLGSVRQPRGGVAEGRPDLEDAPG
jgi:hypothetical protein